MKVRDFIKLNADIDVYDDVCEELAIAFCGPMMLTEAGEKHFKEVLDYDIELDLSGSIKTAAVKIDGDDGNGWKRRLRKAEEFFFDLAGYCANEDYCKWFISPNFGQYATDPDANVYMTIYCDTTPWYTEEEMNFDNICELSFPRKMVEEFFNRNYEKIWENEKEHSFTEWLQDIYTADDTIDLFSFCKNHGFIAVRED